MRTKFFILILITCLNICSSALAYPEEIPDWQNLTVYKFGKLEFGITSVDEYKETLTDKTKQTQEGAYTIFTEANPSTQYKSSRVGFRNNYLDWVEFEFKSPIKVSQIISIYGPPAHNNKKYSTIYNYYDYGFFNITVDKQNRYATAVSIFEIPYLKDSAKKIIIDLPEYSDYNFINKFIPGRTLESDFILEYQGLLPIKNKIADTDSSYSIDTKLLAPNKLYSEAYFYFKNGILTFVSLKPKQLLLKEIVKLYGNTGKKSAAKAGYSYIEYKNFILIVDNKTNRVLNVGIISSL